MANLTFEQTISVDVFKSTNNVDTIEIVENPKNGKLFFTAGTITGCVAGNFDDVLENPAMSLVKGSTGEPFWMLHKKQSNNLRATL